MATGCAGILGTMWWPSQTFGKSWHNFFGLVERDVRCFLVREGGRIVRFLGVYVAGNSEKEELERLPVSYTHLTLPTNREV